VRCRQPVAPVAAEFAAGIRAVLGGVRDDFSTQYDCHSPTRQRWFAARVTRFPGEGPVRAVIVHENITQRTLAEMALRRSEQRLNSILASLNDVVWSLSPDTYELLYLNPARNNCTAIRCASFSLTAISGST